MHTSWNKYQKITTHTRDENEANKTGFTIVSLFSKDLCNKQNFRQRTRKHTKTLLNSKDAWERAALLEKAFHENSNKIYFNIFRVVEN